MNRDVEKQARVDSGAGPQVFDLRARVPGMDDKALAVLLNNAQRLASDGTKQQKMAASELIPVIEGELAGRAKGKTVKIVSKPLGRAPKSR